MKKKQEKDTLVGSEDQYDAKTGHVLCGLMVYTSLYTIHYSLYNGGSRFGFRDGQGKVCCPTSPGMRCYRT